MDDSIRHHYVEIPDTQWEPVYRLIHDNSYSPEEKKKAMLAAFAEHDIPINGYLRDGMDWSFVEAARRLYCEPLMEILVEQAPNKATEGLHILAECVWSESCVKTLLNRGYGISPEDNQPSSRLLRQCAEYGSPGAIALLAAKGLQLDTMMYSFDDRVPAIVHAARHGKTKIIEAFLRAGADPAFSAEDGETFLHASVRLSEKKATDRVDSPPKVQALADILEVAKELGLDVNIRDGAGQTPLHIAAKCGYQNKASLLLDYGADPNLRDNNRKTPVMLARAAKRVGMVAFLQSWKARQAIMDTVKLVASRAAAHQ